MTEIPEFELLDGWDNFVQVGGFLENAKCEDENGEVHVDGRETLVTALVDIDYIVAVWHESRSNLLD